MRLGSGKTDLENHKITEFSKWVLDVGDGKVGNIHQDDVFSDPKIFIPKKFLIENFSNLVKRIVDIIYPNFAKNMKFESYLRERAILTPTNALVDDVNSHILDLIPGTSHINLSQDSIDDSYGDMDNDYEASFNIQ